MNSGKRFFIFFPLILLLSGCSIKLGQTSQNLTEGQKQILMVVAPIDFRDAEYFEPKKIFERAGFEVKTASIQSGVARGADGGEVKIDLTVSEADPALFAAATFIGGPGMAQIIDDESLAVLALKFRNADKLVAAICVAPAILARANMLEGVEATSCPEVKADLERNGAIYQDRPVVSSGKIITANGPAAAREFGETILKNL